MLKNQGQDVARRFFFYFGMCFSFVLLAVSLLKLAYVCGWTADPVSTFIGEWLQTLSLIKITIAAIEPIVFNSFFTFFTARQQKQMAVLEQV